MKKSIDIKYVWDNANRSQKSIWLNRATYSDKDAILNWKDLTPGQKEDLYEVISGRQSKSAFRGTILSPKCPICPNPVYKHEETLIGGDGNRYHSKCFFNYYGHLD